MPTRPGKRKRTARAGEPTAADQAAELMEVSSFAPGPVPSATGAAPAPALSAAAPPPATLPASGPPAGLSAPATGPAAPASAAGLPPAAGAAGTGPLPGVLAGPPDPHAGSKEATAVLEARKKARGAGPARKGKPPKVPPVSGGQV